MRAIWTSLVCFCLLIGAGCKGSSNPMVGKWKLEPSEKARNGYGGAPNVNVEFKEDNTFRLELVAEGRTEVLTGRYALSEKTLTMTPEMEGGKPSHDDPEVTTLSDDMKSFPAPGASDMGTMVKQ